ncbi:MAG: type II toxin-antitoxin system VapC family toxin [Verrucomicrobiales bacterium]|nr:type II toxin-antitoxin system VapC family toxin [Verrucomicrobiales bacterium]
MLVLDTDHVSALSHPSEASLNLLERIRSSGDDAVTTIVTVEEQLRGWLAEIHRLANPHHQIVAYDRLQRHFDFFAAWRVLPWDTESADRFVYFRRQGVRIGSMDLKIACIALAHDATLLTRNTSDFAKVVGLRVANWLD